MSTKRTKEDRWKSVGTSAVEGIGLGALAGLVYGRKLPLKKMLPVIGGASASGGMLGGLWRGGTEIGGSIDNDDYTGRVLGGLVTVGPFGAGLSALDTYLLKRKLQEKDK